MTRVDGISVVTDAPGEPESVLEVPGALLPWKFGLERPGQAPRRKPPLEIIVAEPLRMVRAAYSALISGMEGMRPVAEAATGIELLAVLRTGSPSVVVADKELRDHEGGSAIARVRESYPNIPVLALATDDSRTTLERALASGAAGYWSKCATPEEFELALRNVATSGAHLRGSAIRHLLAQSKPGHTKDPLTARQRQIVTMFAHGISAKQIAFDLGLSVSTVDVHRGRIFERLGIRSIADLTRYAIRRGFING